MTSASAQLSFSDIENDLVKFETIEESYDIGHDICIVYQLGKDVKPSAWDWVGLLKTGWTDPRDYIVWEWAPAHPRDNLLPDRRSVLFQAQKIKYLANSPQLYQLIYATEDRDVLGVSKCFTLRDDFRDVDMDFVNLDDLTENTSYDPLLLAMADDKAEAAIVDSFEIIKESMNRSLGVPPPLAPCKVTFDPLTLVKDFTKNNVYSRHMWENIVPTSTANNRALVPYIPIYTTANSQKEPVEEKSLATTVVVTHEILPSTNPSLRLPFNSQSVIESICKAFNASCAVESPESLNRNYLMELPFAMEPELPDADNCETKSTNTSLVKSPTIKSKTTDSSALRGNEGVRNSSSYGPVVTCRPKTTCTPKNNTTGARSHEALKEDLRDKLKVIKKRERGQSHVKKVCIDCKRRNALDTVVEEQCKQLVKEIDELKKDSSGLDELLTNKNSLIHELSISLKSLIAENSILSAEMDNLRDKAKAADRNRIITKELNNQLDERTIEKLQLTTRSETLADEVAELRLEKMTMLEKNVQQQQETKLAKQAQTSAERQLNDLLYTLSLKGYTTMVDSNNNTIDLQGKEGKTVMLHGWDIVSTKKTSKQNNKLFNKLREQEGFNESLREANSELQEKQSELQILSTELKKQLDIIASDYTSANQHNENYEIEIAALQEIISDLRNENTQLQGTLCETERGMCKIAEQNTAIETMKEEIARLQQTVQYQPIGTTDMRQELEDTTKKMKDKSMKLDAKTRKLMEKIKKLKHLKLELARSEALLQEFANKERTLTRIILRDRQHKTDIAKHFHQREEAMLNRIRCLEHILEASRLLQKSNQGKDIQSTPDATIWNNMHDIHSTESICSSLALLALSYADPLDADDDILAFQLSNNLLTPRVPYAFKVDGNATAHSLSALSDLGYPKVVTKKNENPNTVGVATSVLSEQVDAQNNPLDLSMQQTNNSQKTKKTNTKRKLKYSEVVKGLTSPLPSDEYDDESHSVEQLIADEPLSEWPALRKTQDEAQINPSPYSNNNTAQENDDGGNTIQLQFPEPTLTYPTSCYCSQDKTLASPQNCPYCQLTFPCYMDGVTIQTHITRHERLGF